MNVFGASASTIVGANTTGSGSIVPAVAAYYGVSNVKTVAIASASSLAMSLVAATVIATLY